MQITDKKLSSVLEFSTYNLHNIGNNIMFDVYEQNIYY